LLVYDYMEDKKDYKQKLKYVEQVLFNDWDPIFGGNAGFEAFDEYDSYAPRIVSMWFDGKLTEDAVVKYLLEIETENMELQGNEKNTRKVAKKLIHALTII
jgi:hypothetical protein